MLIWRPGTVPMATVSMGLAGGSSGGEYGGTQPGAGEPETDQPGQQQTPGETFSRGPDPGAVAEAAGDASLSGLPGRDIDLRDWLSHLGNGVSAAQA